LQKLKAFIGSNYQVLIICNTKMVKNLFKLKDQVKHRANVIYKIASLTKPEIAYIGETKLIVEERWKQHHDPKHDSAPSKYLRNNIDDQFKCEIIAASYSHWLKRKIHESLFIAKEKPFMNKQVDCHRLVLFQNGVT